MISIDQFNAMFTIPNNHEGRLEPGGRLLLAVPAKTKAVITDVHIKNIGIGQSTMAILEQFLEQSFALRYYFRTEALQETKLHFSTGLKLGDQSPILGHIGIQNEESSKADILVRVNGFIVH